MASLGSVLSNIGSWFSDKLTPITGFLGSLVNAQSQYYTNKSNERINQQTLDYNTAMTREQWERDDTAHQREVADLEAAGLSPLANTTGSQVTSALGAPQQIAMQAPQIDTNALINSMLGKAQLDEQHRHNVKQENHESSELVLKGEEIRNQADSLEIQNKQVEGQIKYYADLIEQETKTIQEANRHNQEEEYLRRVEYESEQYWKEVNEQNPGKYPHIDYYDYSYYMAQKSQWNIKFSRFIEKIGATQEAHATSSAQNYTGSFGIGATVPGTPVGGSLNASGTQGESKSKYDSQDLSKKQEAMLQEFYQNNPVPVYHIKKWELKK